MSLQALPLCFNLSLLVTEQEGLCAFQLMHSVTEKCKTQLPWSRTALFSSMDAMLGQIPSTRQYLFGDALLLAPVTAPGGCPAPRGTNVLSEPCGLTAHDVWLPPGNTWFELHTGSLIKPGGLKRHMHLFDTPVYAKGGSVVCRRVLDQTKSSLLGAATRSFPALEWTIHPGGSTPSGQGQIYEDDGETLKYLDGKFSDTILQYVWSGASLTINVTTQGSFDELPVSRPHSIVLPLLPPPAAVHVDGTALASARERGAPGAGVWSYDGANLAVIIDAPYTKTAEPLTIQVLMPNQPAPAQASAALSGLPGLILNAQRAKGNLDEARIAPGAQVPDPKFGKPLSRVAQASDSLGLMALDANPQRFEAKVQEIRAATTAAQTELLARRAKAKGNNAARLQYSLDILMSLP